VPVALPGKPTGLAGQPPRSIAEILDQADLNDPAQRATAVTAIEALEMARKRAGVARAEELGIPTRVVRPDGTVIEVAGVEPDGRPLFLMTHNVNAAISTNASLTRTGAYNLKGTGMTIGVWDGGAARTTHQEFTNGRVTIGEAVAPAVIDHATHVCGTLAAAGTIASALGMSPEAAVISYDWTADMSETASRGASAPGQAGKIYLSNHSYGYITGWYKTGGTNPAFIWYGTAGTTNTSVDTTFGTYNSYTQSSDSVAYNAPYFLMFRSAGNDRGDNPTNGQSVQLSSGGSSVSYNSSLHPAGDGTYRGGYDTMGYDSVAKNVITIGSVADAVTSSLRDPSKATMSSFSAWGPTDDGRIKPDVVANGEGVYSSVAGTTSAYSTYNGTSMATPNAAGTATHLIQEYIRLFPAGAMRSSTLKALLIHTADDLGTTGPDYSNGWGLINAKAAVDLIRDHAAAPLKTRINESAVTSTITTVNHDFIWDGVSPIRVTLCWTDPAGSIVADDNPSQPLSRLRNNLDVKVTAPNTTVLRPYVMPFVGTWTQASMSAPATTGVNNTDNVEQVFIANPTASGTYRVTVTYQNTLFNNSAQPYSLIISGSAEVAAPPPVLALTAVSPSTGIASGSTTLDLTGSSLATATQVKLTRSGSPDILATNLQMVGSSLRCSVNLTGATPGLWNVVVSSPSESSTLPNSFSVAAALFYENFDNNPSGWGVDVSNAWTLTTAASHTPSTSYFIAAPAAKILSALTTPAIAIGTIPNGMQLKFWHNYNTQANQDGGRLEFSVDGGANWFGVEDANSGASFASNGYNSDINNRGNPDNRSAFATKSAWSGNSNGFIQTIVNLTAAKFSNKTIKIRWVLATNATGASTGWYVDTVLLTSDLVVPNNAPTITTAANAPGRSTLVETVDSVDYTYYLVPATNTNLNVVASDDGGAANLTYAWAGSGPGPVTFSPNGTNGASTTKASFEAIGDYSLTVTVTDSGGLATSSTVLVRVTQAATSLRVTPSTFSLPVATSKLFAAELLDQFGNPLATQPGTFTWTTTGGASVTSGGSFSASAKGSYTVSAASGGFSNFAQVNVTPLAATITLGNLSQPYTGSQRTPSATTSPGTYPVNLTYDGSPTAPTNVGTYAVVAIVDTPTHEGSAEATFTITASFASWRDGKFSVAQITAGDANPDADPDRDGLRNLAEYALDTNPNSFTPAPAVVLTPDFLTLTFTRPKGRSDVTYSAESSAALASWAPVTLELTGSTDTTETLRARVSRTEFPTTRYLRLKFQQ
jgi:hypothetical protein